MTVIMQQYLLSHVLLHVRYLADVLGKTCCEDVSV